MARATTSLPVPLSPMMSTGKSVRAIRSKVPRRAAMAGLSPMMRAARRAWPSSSLWLRISGFALTDVGKRGHRLLGQRLERGDILRGEGAVFVDDLQARPGARCGHRGGRRKTDCASGTRTSYRWPRPNSCRRGRYPRFAATPVWITRPTMPVSSGRRSSPLGKPSAGRPTSSLRALSHRKMLARSQRKR